MDKPVHLHLNANRYISGTLRGYDMFLNLVLDNAVEDVQGEKTEVGTTVSPHFSLPYSDQHSETDLSVWVIRSSGVTR
jgi:small nuclear ribonucleoprotein (snRNP)-like protein